MPIKTNRFTQNTQFVLLMLLYLCGTLYFLNDDLWNDEIYTLQHFVLVPLKTTVSDYHVPNNHVFFSLICNLYLKIIGVKTLVFLMQNVWIIRSINLIFTGVSLYFFIKISAFLQKNKPNESNHSLTFWVLFIYLTTLPFYVFQLQLRGYGLLMALNTVILYLSLTLQQEVRWRHFFGLILAVSLSVYTIPSNLFVIFGLIAFATITIISTVFSNKKRVFLSNKTSFMLVFGLLLGILLGLGFYGSMLKSVFGNEYVQQRAIFSDMFWSFHISLQHFFSWRIGLLLAAVFGVFFHIKNKENYQQLGLVFSGIAMPYIALFATYSAAPPRVFTEILPFFAVFLGISIVSFFKNQDFNFIKKYNNWLFFVIIAISLLGLTFSFYSAKRQVFKDLLTYECRSQDVNCNYYQHYYKPSSEILALKSRNLGLPIVVINSEPHDITHFLEAFKMPYTRNLDSMITTKQNFVVLARYIDAFKYRMSYKYPNIKFEHLQNDRRYYPKAVICKLPK